ncbi:MAG: signal peptidase I [Nitrososphaerales archaeon]
MKIAYIIAPLVVAVVFLIFPFVLYSGNMIMVVTSDSMLPTLKPYDMIVVEKDGIDGVKVGDIIAFDSHLEGIGIIVHRAVEVLDDDGEIGISTKGDNVGEPDGWTVHDEDFIGKVVNSTPSMGIFLIEPVRYAIVAVIVITSISLLREVMVKPKAA